MKEVKFPNWKQVLSQAQLSNRERKSYEITLRWYLSFGRRSRAGVMGAIGAIGSRNIKRRTSNIERRTPNVER